MSRDVTYLLDILLYAKDIRTFTTGMDREAFLADVKTQHAVLRCLEVMGEATKRLSPEVRERHADIPWKELAGMRDILIHAYNRVDLNKVWDAVEKNIPSVITALEAMIPPEKDA